MSKYISIRYSNKALREFRKIARKSRKKEILGYLIGHIEDRTYWVDDIYYPPQRGGLLWVYALTKGLPKGYLGSIHSHPRAEVDYVSPEDIKTSIEDGDKIFAIFRFDKRGRGMVCWYSLTELIGRIKGF